MSDNSKFVRETLRGITYHRILAFQANEAGRGNTYFTHKWVKADATADALTWAFAAFEGVEPMWVEWEMDRLYRVTDDNWSEASEYRVDRILADVLLLRSKTDNWTEALRIALDGFGVPYGHEEEFPTAWEMANLGISRERAESLGYDLSDFEHQIP